MAMTQLYPDIPRFYTALAEVLSCVFIFLVQKSRLGRTRFILLSLIFIAWQTGYLILTDDLPMRFWIPCMLGAVLFMFLYIAVNVGPSLLSGYATLNAFILAEFAASFEWQIVCFLGWQKPEYLAGRIVLLVLVYGFVFLGFTQLQRITSRKSLPEISIKEFLPAALIAILVFTLSNLSFVTTGMLFTSPFRADIFNIRTLVDLAGIVILYAFQSRLAELRAEKEVAAIDSMLQSQYEKYRSYQESIDLINLKYHDLKHQIEGMRAKMTNEERSAWLDSMQQELSAYSPQLQTGNQVLDAILDSKMSICRKKNITLTCVADGTLLQMLHVTDICTIFGNALDNAIESVVMTEDPEKRLIHLLVTAKKQFVYISVENYCTEKIMLKNGYPVTTKDDHKNHGFGIKSICTSVEKYHGNVRFGAENGLFSLTILIPAENQN